MAHLQNKNIKHPPSLPLHSLVVHVQLHKVQVLLPVDGEHDGLLLLGMAQSQGVANLVHKHMREAGTILAAVHMPMLKVVQVDVPVQGALHLVVWVESVGQNVAAVFAWAIELEGEEWHKLDELGQAMPTMCESP